MVKHFSLIFLLFLIQSLSYANALELFGKSEVMSDNLTAFSKWNGMLERHKNIDQEDWKNFLESLKKEDKAKQIEMVNNHMNEHKYVLDIINWGVNDYWETPYEFYTKDGDCEDYAISKYMALKELGFPADNMRVVILQDKNLRVIHSVLALYEKDNILILDNQIKQIMNDKKIYHYQPVYSINENHWWRHN